MLLLAEGASDEPSGRLLNTRHCDSLTGWMRTGLTLSQPRRVAAAKGMMPGGDPLGRLQAPCSSPDSPASQDEAWLSKRPSRLIWVVRIVT